MQTIETAPQVSVPRALNISSEYIDRPVAEGRGGLPALRFVDGTGGGQTFTYAELQSLVNRGAAALAKAGLEMEQRVAILLDDSPAWLAAFFGAIKLGAVPVPFNTILPPADYCYLLNDSRARLLVADAGHWAVLRGRRDELKFLRDALISGEAGPVEASWDAALAVDAGDLDPAPTTCDDVAFWLYSSGSTGAPKGRYTCSTTCSSASSSTRGRFCG